MRPLQILLIAIACACAAPEILWFRADGEERYAPACAIDAHNSFLWSRDSAFIVPNGQLENRVGQPGLTKHRSSEAPASALPLVAQMPAPIVIFALPVILIGSGVSTIADALQDHPAETTVHPPMNPRLLPPCHARLHWNDSSTAYLLFPSSPSRQDIDDFYALAMLGTRLRGAESIDILAPWPAPCAQPSAKAEEATQTLQNLRKVLQQASGITRISLPAPPLCAEILRLEVHASYVLRVLALPADSAAVPGL